MERIPGSHEKNTKDKYEKLKQWVVSVRTVCTDLSRLKIADQMIGQLLSKAKVDEDDVWPEGYVCDVIEDIRSNEMALGVYLGAVNSRGVFHYGNEGKEELELAQKYRGWADNLRSTHPFVSSTILNEIARFYEDQRKQIFDDEKKESRLGYFI